MKNALFFVFFVLICSNLFAAKDDCLIDVFVVKKADGCMR